MVDLKEKVVLVTGGAGGIGAACVRRFAAEGARVVITDIDAAAGAALAGELGEGTVFHRLDVRRREDWTRVLAAVDADYGGLDVLFLNAGVNGVRPLGAPVLDDPLPWLTVEGFEKVWPINVAGVLIGALDGLPLLRRREGAQIVVTSSGAGIGFFAPDPIYTMSKHAVNGFSVALAETLQPLGIAVNALAPSSPVDTGMMVADYGALHGLTPASEMADAVMTILSSGETGQVWVTKSSEPRLYKHSFNPL